MAKSVKHKFVSAIPDGTDDTIVRPSNWNDDHDLTDIAASGANSDITSMTGITGGISSPDYIAFDTTYATPLTAGQLGWNGNDTLGLGMIGGNVVQHIGEDTFFYVKASSTITKGQLCMFTGTVGSSGVLTAAPATAIPYAEAIIGVAAENIANNGFGLIQNTGTLRGVDTSAFSDGDILYYNSAVTGGFTNVFPASGPIVVAAAVGKSGSSGSGILTVRISFQTRVTAGTGISVTQGNDSVTVTNTSPNTYDPSNVAITGGTINGTSIGATTPSTGVFTTLTATGQTSLGGVAGSESMRVVSPLVTGTFVQVQSESSSFAGFRATGSNANNTLGFVSRGSGTVSFYTNNSTSNEQFRVSPTASAVNYVQVTGNVTGSRPVVSAQGSDANIGLNLASKGNRSISLLTNSVTAFDVLAPVSSVNYLTANGSITNQDPLLSAQGADTNISLALQSKGTGGVNLATGSTGVNLSNGTTVTSITRRSAGTGYTSLPTIAIGAPQLSGGVQATASATAISLVSLTSIASGGTGYTVGDVLTLSGGTFTTAIQFTVTTVSAGVVTGVSVTNFGNYTAIGANPVACTGGTGTGATFNVSLGVLSLSVTNAGSGYVEQPTVTFSGGGGSGADAYASVGSASVIRSLAGASSTSLDFNTPASISTGVPQLRIRDQNADSFPMTFNQAAGATFIAQGNANANFNIASNGSGAVRLLTNGGSLVEQFRVAHTASAVNYVQVTGSVTGAGASAVTNIQFTGSDTNVSGALVAKGFGYIAFAGGGSTANQALRVNTTGAVSTGNLLQINGAAAGSAPSISAISGSSGTDTNIALTLETKGNSGVNLYNSATATSFGLELGANTTVDKATYIDFHSSSGTDYDFRIIRFGNINANADLTNSGTGSVRTLTGGGEQFRVSNTASAVNYVQVTGGATGAGVTIIPQGSDANILLALNSKGTNPIQCFTNGARQFQISNTTSAANFLQVTGGVASASPILSSQGADTNIDLSLTTKGTGALKFNTGGGEQFRVTNTASADIYWAATGGIGGAGRATLTTAGSTTATSMQIVNHTAAPVIFLTGNAEQLRVAHTASAVNYVQLTGGATGASPAISPQGSDTNINLRLQVKGTGGVSFAENRTNYITAFGAGTGGSPSFLAQGSDTNIDLTLTPKGTGNVRFGTHTATSDTAISGYIEIKDASGTIRKLAVIT
jgi:hypothetical protein